MKFSGRRRVRWAVLLKVDSPRRPAGGVSSQPVGLESTFPLSTLLAHHGVAIGQGRVAPACWWPVGSSLMDCFSAMVFVVGREGLRVVPVGHALLGQSFALGRREQSDRRVGDVRKECEAKPNALKRSELWIFEQVIADR